MKQHLFNAPLSATTDTGAAAPSAGNLALHYSHHDGSGASAAMRHRQPRAMRVYDKSKFKKSAGENAELMRRLMPADAAAPAAPALGEPVTIKLHAHVIDSASRLQSKRGGGAQEVLLVPFKQLTFSGLPKDVLQDFREGKAFFAPNKIVIDEFGTNATNSGLYAELVGVKAKDMESAHPKTGALAVHMPVAQLMKNNGLLGDLVLYDRPHDEGTANFLPRYGSIMCSPAELQKAYTPIKDGTLVYGNTVLEAHYLTNQHFQYRTPPLQVGEDIKFGNEDFADLLSDLQETFSAKAAVLDRNMALRVSCQDTHTLDGAVQPGRFFSAFTADGKPAPDERFELMLSATMTGHVLGMADSSSN